MRWLKSRKKASAVLGLGGLLVTGLGLAESAQAAGSYNIMVRKDSTLNIGSVVFVDPNTTNRSGCTSVQNDIYNSTGFQVAESSHLVMITYGDTHCQNEGYSWGIDAPSQIATDNWWYTATW